MEDVLQVYEKPLSRREPVVCVEEKPVVLHEDIRVPQPARPNRLGRRDYEYRRCGTANVFCGVEPKAGRHFLKATPTRPTAEFAEYLAGIVAAYPKAMTIPLGMDHRNTHQRKSLVQQYGEREGGLLWNCFRVHHTPKHGSWLNQAEIEVGRLSRQCLDRRRIASHAELQRQVHDYNLRLNNDQTTIQWKFSRKNARPKFNCSFMKSQH